MYQHIDTMVAQSLAREREHDLQADLRQRQGGARRPQGPRGTEAGGWHDGGWHDRMHDLLLRARLVHATPH